MGDVGGSTVLIHRELAVHSTGNALGGALPLLFKHYYQPNAIATGLARMFVTPLLKSVL